MILFSIDRFEGKYAICENLSTNEFCNIPKKDLPKNCKEGSIIKFENSKYTLDDKTTKSKQDDVKSLIKNLFNRN